MTNVALRRAMLDAHVTRQDLADRCGVDVKTVERWLQDEARDSAPAASMVRRRSTRS